MGEGGSRGGGGGEEKRRDGAVTHWPTAIHFLV